MIKGLTDQPVFRRDGKIRGGLRNNNDYPVNTPYFVLADAPQLIPVLGDKPTEILFTFFFDDVNAVAPTDLRWYTKSELVCVGNNETAAYFGVGDLPGLKQTPGKLRYKNPDGSDGYTVYNRSRERICQYKQCSDYLAGKCSEHTVLRLVIPQYSMSAWFDHDNTSINGLLNIMGAIDKVRMARGKISGEIFRLYKDKADLTFEGKDGKKGKREGDVVNMAHVPFELYEKNYRSKIKDEDWNALMMLRNSGIRTPSQAFLLQGADAPQQLAGPEVQAALPAPQASGPSVAQAATVTEADQEKALLERANHPVVLPIFEELAALTGKPNTEAIRIATAKAIPSVEQMVTKLKVRLSSLKKEKEQKELAATPVTPPTQPAQTPQVLPPEAKQAAASQASIF